jgi:hypothetical protein
MKDYILNNLQKGQSYKKKEMIRDFQRKHPEYKNKETMRRSIMGLTKNHDSNHYYNKNNNYILYQIDRHTLCLIEDKYEDNSYIKKLPDSTLSTPKSIFFQRAKSIPEPTSLEVQKYLDEWHKLENYVLQESALQKLFINTYPKNEEMDDILIKVCSLNDFYSTNIFSPFIVAKHIFNIGIDSKLAQNDLTIVNEIAQVKINELKNKHFYSFATKYCSHHKPEMYPIYDSFVERVLKYFNKVYTFFDQKQLDFKDYIDFRDILVSFQNHFKLNKFSLKEIDRYLWLIGKEYFPKKYKKARN